MEMRFLMLFIFVSQIAFAQFKKQAEKIIGDDSQYFVNSDSTLLRVDEELLQVEVFDQFFNLKKTIPLGVEKPQDYTVFIFSPETRFLYISIGKIIEEKGMIKEFYALQFNKITHDIKKINVNKEIKIPVEGPLGDNNVFYSIGYEKWYMLDNATVLYRYDFSSLTMSEIEIKADKGIKYNECQKIQTYDGKCELILLDEKSSNKVLNGKIFNLEGNEVKKIELNLIVNEYDLDIPVFYKTAENVYSIFGTYSSKKWADFLGFYYGKSLQGEYKFIPTSNLKNYAKGLSSNSLAKYQEGKPHFQDVEVKTEITRLNNSFLLIVGVADKVETSSIFFTRIRTRILVALSEEGELKWDYAYFTRPDLQEPFDRKKMSMEKFQNNDYMSYSVSNDILSISSYMFKAQYKFLQLDRHGNVLLEQDQVFPFFVDKQINAVSTCWYGKSFFIMGESKDEKDNSTFTLYRYGY